MKLRHILLCIGLLAGSLAASAKDVITLTDGSEIDAKVEEITETVIKYRKATNPTGPIYSIARASVLTILYENGSTDTFTPVSTTDEELMNYAAAASQVTPSRQLSDSELLRMSLDPNNLYNKANKYRRIGWIGGGAFLAAGAIAGVILWGIYSWDSCDISDGLLMPLGIGAAAGAIWTLGFNLKANSVMKKARELEMYSANFIENEVVKLGSNSLMAGVGIMGNQATRTQGVGLSFKFNF
ncbi:MAG: hypothetical protein K2G21_02020 [Muribaculaceae bacterium]|nr:hypothetical protein [Muribaculaceae bacterium]